jgi:hypothetical protein
MLELLQFNQSKACRSIRAEPPSFGLGRQSGPVAGGELGLQLGDAGFQRRDIFFHLVGREARGDVLRAIPVVRDNLDKDQPFDFAAEKHGCKLIGQLGMFTRVEHTSVPEQLESCAMWVVHHEESNPIGGTEIARADQLAVTLEVREADKIRPQNLNEPGWASAVLEVGPPRLADGRHVEAVARGNKISFVVSEFVGLGRILHQLVPPEVFVLGLLHGGREHNLQEFGSHSEESVWAFQVPISGSLVFLWVLSTVRKGIQKGQNLDSDFGRMSFGDRPPRDKRLCSH